MENLKVFELLVAYMGVSVITIFWDNLYFKPAGQHSYTITLPACYGS